MSKPHLDFASRENIDGSEEIYSQNAAWEQPEQKFTTAQLAAYILDQMPPTNEEVMGANVGTSGIGVFDGKVGDALQFRNIVAKSSAVSVDLNGKNIEIDIDPNQLNPTMNFADLQDINSPESGNSMLLWTGAGYDWIERAVSTAKNVGTSGIGVFDTKTNFEFAFRNIAPKSDKVLITLSGKNIEVDVNMESIAGELNFGDLNDMTQPEGNDVILHWNGTSYDWIETPSGGGGIGGTLTENTLIDTSSFDFEIKYNTVAVKKFETNPFWAAGEESFFIHAKNDAQDTENIVGVTEQAGGIIQLWSRKPNDGTYAYLWQTPGTTNFRCVQNATNNRTEVTFTHNGVFMDAYHLNSSQDRGTFSMSENLSQLKRIKNGYIVNLKYQEKTTSQHNLEVLFEGIPEYADMATAQTLGYPSNGVFKTPSGAVFIVP